MSASVTVTVVKKVVMFTGVCQCNCHCCEDGGDVYRLFASGTVTVL